MMQKIIILISSTMFFLLSLFSCEDEFDKMCKEHEGLLRNFKKIELDSIHPINFTELSDEVKKKIKEGVWVLFKITLREKESKEISIYDLANEMYLKYKGKERFFSIFKDSSFASANTYYFFITDINTYKYIKFGEPSSLFYKIANFVGVEVVYSHWPKDSIACINELFFKCSYLENVNLENLDFTNKEVNRLFAGCFNLKKVRFPESDYKAVFSHGEHCGVLFSNEYSLNKNISIICTPKFLLDNILNTNKNLIMSCVKIGNESLNIMSAIEAKRIDLEKQQMFSIYKNDFK